MEAAEMVEAVVEDCHTVLFGVFAANASVKSGEAVWVLVTSSEEK